jgi:hypothetical protein
MPSGAATETGANSPRSARGPCPEGAPGSRLPGSRAASRSPR